MYLDDFLLIGRDYEECVRAQQVVISLLRRFGFGIAWSKVEGPVKKLIFLGLEINIDEMPIALPKSKSVNCWACWKDFSVRKRASCKQLQRIAGKLNWTSQVIKCGRCYLRKILDIMAPLRMSNHKARLSNEFQQDIAWWIQALLVYPGNLCSINHLYMLFSLMPVTKDQE